MTAVEPRPLAPTRGYALGERCTADAGTVHLTGVQALARMVLEVRRADRAAGLDTRAFVSG